ncbi:MAG: diguanylate cyclase [Desulfatiglans sp.]|jgi:diguanylate cyclase (GGDEF)-like protein|nr:diguanylate cyclase [Desulfatiglans sp.]
MINPLSILVVEDDPSSRLLLQKTLTSESYAVISAENGGEALQRLRQHVFRVVITDWMMPGIDGIELCRRIRQQDEDYYIYTIILTARDSKNDIVTALNAGADDYIVKPFHRGELIARLNIVKRYLEIETSLKEANEKIKIMSVTDTLTKLFNRLHVTEKLPYEMVMAKNRRSSLSVIMCDIDHFKRVNDMYGHQSGDRVLEEFSECLRESIRTKRDWIARYGGEEFVIVLPDTEIAMARTVAERVRMKVSEKSFSVIDGKINITASFGVACYDPNIYRENVSWDALIGIVDRYLYQAKSEGRNMVKWR